MRRTSTEMEIKVSNGRITSAEILKDDTCKIVAEMDTESANANNVFVLCEASKLSLDDEFMKHIPCSKREEEFKESLEEAIKSGLKDFYRPVCDPSFDETGNICYVSGAKPAVGKSYNWWEETAKKFCPERGSRLGMKKEYIAFLGILIKELSKAVWIVVDARNGVWSVADAQTVVWNVADAWNAVCTDSKELGHYWNSLNAKKHEFEPTYSRKVCGFYDLANTYKILLKDKDEEGYPIFWYASGSYICNRDVFPLANINRYCFFNSNQRDSVGWLVLEK